MLAVIVCHGHTFCFPQCVVWSEIWVLQSMDVSTKSLWGAHQQNGCHIRTQHWCMCHISLFSVDWRFEFASLRNCNLWCLMLEKRGIILAAAGCALIQCCLVCLFDMWLVIGKQPPLSCHILIRNSTRHLLRDTHPCHKFHVIIQVPNEVCRNRYGCRG